MKIFSFFILFLVFSNINFAQQVNLIYDCKRDSNDYLKDIRPLNGQLFFISGKARNPKGIYFCGHSGPRDFRERHVYEYDFDNNKARKVFHHDLENDFVGIENRHLDSSKIVTQHKFYALSDTVGVFLPNNRNSTFWTKKGQQFEKVHLPKNYKISNYYPAWHQGKLHIQGRNEKTSGRIWTLDTLDFKLQTVLQDTFAFQRHNYHYWGDHTIFHAYAKTYDKDSGLFLEKKPGEIIKISRFPTAMTFSSFQTIYKNKIIYRVTHRGKKYSYTNTDFTNTELWAYDVNKDSSEMIFDFGKYGLTYSPTIFNGQLYWTFGYHEYNLYQLKKGKVTPSNPELQYIRPKLIPFEQHLHFIGVDTLEQEHLYVLDQNDNITKAFHGVSKIKFLQVIGNRIYFIARQIGGQRDIFSLNVEGEDLKQHSDLGLEEKYSKVKMLEMEDKIYWFIRNHQQNQLYVSTATHPHLKFVLKDVQMPDDYGEVNYFVKDTSLFVTASSIESKYFNQIWKID